MQENETFASASRRNPILNDGVWDLVITDVRTALDHKTNEPRLTDGGVPMVEIVFEASDGYKVDEVKRHCSPSLKQNYQTKAWSILAQIIKAALGYPYGQQQDVTPAMLKGARLRGTGEHNADGYPRLLSFTPAETRPQTQASRPAPATREDPKTAKDGDDLWDGFDDPKESKIPF